MIYANCLCKSYCSEAELQSRRRVTDVEVTLMLGVYSRLNVHGDTRWKVFVDVDWYDPTNVDVVELQSTLQLVNRLIDR